MYLKNMELAFPPKKNHGTLNRKMAMVQNYQPPIAGWCYPTMAMIRNLWVIGTIILNQIQFCRFGKPDSPGAR